MEDTAMTLARFNNRMFPSFPSFFDKFLEGDMMDWNNSNFASGNSTLPAINVKENEDEFLIEVAAPGMKKDDFKIHFDNGRLSISSEKKNEREDKEDSYTRREFNYMSFQRSFTVPENLVNVDKIDARYNDGILSVKLPKRDEVKPKPSREIKIH